MSEARSKSERLAEFFLRLQALPPASSYDEAYQQLCDTLTGVENELSGLPNDPERWMALDRMFPPQRDRRSKVVGCDVQRFDNLKHITYIGANGAIEIRSKRRVAGRVATHLSKPGADGRRVVECCPDLAARNL